MKKRLAAEVGWWYIYTVTRTAAAIMRTRMKIPTIRPAWSVPPFFSAALSSVEAVRNSTRIKLGKIKCYCLGLPYKQEDIICAFRVVACPIQFTHRKKIRFPCFILFSSINNDNTLPCKQNLGILMFPRGLANESDFDFLH